MSPRFLDPTNLPRHVFASRGKTHDCSLISVFFDILPFCEIDIGQVLVCGFLVVTKNHDEKMYDVARGFFPSGCLGDVLMDCVVCFEMGMKYPLVN